MKTLGDLIALQRGHDLPEQDRRSGTVPVIGSAGLTGFHDSAKAKGPGVTLGRSGASFGQVTFVKEDFWPHNATLYVTDFKGNDIRYISYLLESIDFSSLNSGSAQQSLNRNYLYGIPVVDHPVATQRRIAGILSTYDDLIENCEQRIRVLDEMVRALYREWFVDFRFPGHRAGAKLPVGWRRSVADDVAVEVRRSVPKGAVGEVCYVGLEHIPRRSLALDSWEVVSELGSNKLRFEAGELLFGKIRPYFHKVAVAPCAGVCSADTFVIRPRDPAMYGFMVGLVSNDEFVAHASATANGAKMPRANWDVMMQFPISIPSNDVLSRFDEFTRPWLDEQRNLVARIRLLREARDLLMPRLLSDQLRVAEAA